MRDRKLSTDDDTQLDVYSDALSSVMEDDSGCDARLSAWELTESANNNQLRQRRRKSASSSTEDGEVRAEDNGRREGRKKSTTSTETALPKSTYTHDDASARPASGRAAACHTEERTAMKRLTSLQLIPTRDIQALTDMTLPGESSAKINKVQKVLQWALTPKSRLNNSSD